jgi:hypothetical protein
MTALANSSSCIMNKSRPSARSYVRLCKSELMFCSALSGTHVGQFEMNKARGERGISKGVSERESE